MKRMKVWMLVLSALLCTWGGMKLSASAAEKETELKAVTYTKEDIQGGVIVVPPGDYRKIAFGKSIKNAVVYMNNVNVRDYISIYGDGKSNPTFILTGATKIGKVIVKGNATLTSPDNVRRIETVSIRETVRFELEVAAKNVSIVSGVRNVRGYYHRPISYFVDRGEYGVHYIYGKITRLCLRGKNNGIKACAYVKNAEVLGEGGEYSVQSDMGTITLNGKRSLLSVDLKGVNVDEVIQKEKEAYIIRGERIGLEQKKENEAPLECEALFIGDSFTERLYRSGYLKEGYKGLHGWGTAPSDWYVDGDRALAYLSRLDDYRPKKVVYLYGINDMKSAENIDYSKKLLNAIMEAYPDAGIYVQKVFPLAATWVGAGVNTYADINRNGDYNVEQYNRELEAFCAGQTRLNWVDTTGDMIDGNGDLKVEMTDDGIHLNEAGYAKWWDEIRKILNQ